MIEQLKDELILAGKRFRCSNGNDLLWSDELQLGYLESNGFDYGEDYWVNYLNLLKDDIGRRLTEYRAEFTKKNGVTDPNTVCDVGIGSGQFVGYFGCKGFDVNPCAVDWLVDQEKFADPYKTRFPTLTMWDVLEHIDDPTELLASTDQVMTSLPIHRSVHACLASKHLKPNEHIWHFTEQGIVNFMNLFGFKLIDQGDGETMIGRESILSFCFKRR